MTISKAAAKKARTKARIQSAFYRALRTFTQAFRATFLPLLVVPGSTLHLDTLEKAAWSGAVAGLAALWALFDRWLDAVDAIPTIPPG